MIYLDYTANTPAAPEVVERFCQTEQCFPGNPNSTHSAGRAAKAEMDRITASIAELLHVLPEEIIYTSGASEANNLAIKGLARAARHVGRHIISTPLEHSSVSGPLTALQEQGYEIDLLSIQRDGKIDLGELRELLRKDTILVALCAVDSELGTLQPVQEVAELLKGYPDCKLHVDATQAIGKIPAINDTSYPFDGIDTMSFAPHKFYGLNGSGILLKRKGLALEPLIHGGASTTIYRSGTPALALAAAAETALQIALKQQADRFHTVSEWNRLLRTSLSRYPKVSINSPEGAIPHILNLSVKGVKGGAFQRALDEKGVCVSVKSACSVEGTPSRPVFAVSRDRKRALSSWRISLSHLTTKEELDEFLTIFDELYRELTT